jgi:hypothetical protein
MTDRQTPTPDRSEAGDYEIRLTGHLDARWADWFDGLAVRREVGGRWSQSCASTALDH